MPSLISDHRVVATPILGGLHREYRLEPRPREHREAFNEFLRITASGANVNDVLLGHETASRNRLEHRQIRRGFGLRNPSGLTEELTKNSCAEDVLVR
jgi:hypothetical protein